MPRYEITSPEGKRFEVTAPDGASQDEVMAYAQSQFQPPPPATPIPSNQVAGNPEANIGPFKIQGETASGLNPAAALIKAGGTLDRLNKGAFQAMHGPADWLAQKMGGTPDPRLQAMASEQAQNAPAMRDLQEMHPGSTLLGDLAVAAPTPWRALPAVAASEYGSPMERLARGGAAFLGGKVAQKGGEIASRAFAKSEVRAAESQAANALKDDVTRMANEEGLAVPPSQANPTALNRATEGYAGKLSTQQALSIKNQPKFDALIKQDLGLPVGKPATTEALDAVSRDAYKAGYEPIKREKSLLPDEQFTAERSAVGGQDYAAMVAEVPEMANAKIANLITALDKPEFSGATAVNLVRKLRADAKANYKNFADPDAQAAAQAQTRAVDALEGLIDRNLAARGMQDAVAKFRESRTMIAKAHDAERALNKATGSFDAKEFGKLFDRGRPLTGGAEKVGRFANTYPKASQEINSSMPGISPLDYATFGGIGAAIGNPAMLAGVVSRPLLRSAIASPAYQKLMTQPKYKPSGLLDASRRLLDNEQAPWIAGLLGYQAAN